MAEGRRQKIVTIYFGLLPVAYCPSLPKYLITFEKWYYLIAAQCPTPENLSDSSECGLYLAG
jgi:hypothetical protein